MADGNRGVGLEGSTGTDVSNLFNFSGKVKNWIIANLVEEKGIDASAAEVRYQNMRQFLQGVVARELEGLEGGMSPSPQVDDPWHLAMQRPGAYFRCCLEARVVVDHIPHWPGGREDVGYKILSPTETYGYLGDIGLSPDPELWLPSDPAASCGGQSCYNGDCSGDGRSPAAKGILIGEGSPIQGGTIYPVTVLD